MPVAAYEAKAPEQITVRWSAWTFPSSFPPAFPPAFAPAFPNANSGRMALPLMAF